MESGVAEKTEKAGEKAGAPKEGARNSKIPSPETLLPIYRTQVTEYIDNSTDERKEAEQCRDYFDGKQWTP
ncbi:MAG TPA: hypothetical protein VFS23_33150, partial [Vicinamibacterales bacterium]|nr:hypothetical protein [Vicinamibacterales bacterium]